MIQPPRLLTTRILLLVAFCTIGTFLATADENITVTGVSGNLEPGGELIISGYGFGTKVPAVPVVWDDFDDNQEGEPIGPAIHGEFTRVGSSVYSAVDPYTGNRCAHSQVSADFHEPGLVANWIPFEAPAGFASMKIKMVSAYGSLYPHNVKLLRLNAHSPDPVHGLPNYNVSGDRNTTSFQGIVNHGSPGQYWSGGFSELPDGWNSLSIWDYMSDPDVANGFVGRELNGQVEERSGIVTLRSDAPYGGLRSAFFAGYASHEGYDLDIYLDDVYADITLARVLVRDPDGGNFEMQIPQDWSSNQIRVTANAGRYPSGAELELVVYDADNNASAPFTVYVGENDSGHADDGPPGDMDPPVLELTQP